MENTIAITPNIDINLDAQHDELEKVTNVQLRISIRQAAQEAVDSSSIEGAAGVRVSYPDEHGGQVVESFAGPDSDELYQENPQTGQREERPLPPEAKVEVVRSARGAY